MYNNSDSAWKLRNNRWKSCVVGGEVLDKNEDFIDFDKEKSAPFWKKFLTFSCDEYIWGGVQCS